MTRYILLVPYCFQARRRCVKSQLDDLIKPKGTCFCINLTVSLCTSSQHLSASHSISQPLSFQVLWLCKFFLLKILNLFDVSCFVQCFVGHHNNEVSPRWFRRVPPGPAGGNSCRIPHGDSLQLGHRIHAFCWWVIELPLGFLTHYHPQVANPSQSSCITRLLAS